MLRLFCLIVLVCVPLSGQSLPISFEPGRLDSQRDLIVETGSNVRWAVPIGRPTYGTPIIAHGKVLIGTLNDVPRDLRRDRGRSVLLCLDEKTGTFLWQLALPKDYRIPYFDSYCVGISSNPTIVDRRAFLTTGRGEVLCLDLNGMADGNDGPYRDEAALFTFRDDTRPPFPLTDKDADIVWRYDAFRELKSKPHDTNNCEIIHYDGLLVVNTGNSPDHTHIHVPDPEAPSLIIMDAERGIPLARDDFDIGSDISHGQWCSPGKARIGGVDFLFYGGGNGVLYAVKAPSRDELTRKFEANGRNMIRLETVWKFHGDPRVSQGSPQYSPEGAPPSVMGMGSASYTCLPPPVFDDPADCQRIYMVFGHDAWNGAKPLRSWLACLDAVTGKLLWGTGNIEGGAVAPLVFDEEFVYLADRRGNVHCYDAGTGREYWRLRLKGDIWAKPLVADGKIYIGTDRRLFYTLRKGKTPEVMAEMSMPGPIFAPAATSGGTLYVVGDGFLYAVENEK